MIDKKPGRKSGRVRVTFGLPSALWAERVNLVGDFNEWDTTATPMTRGRTHDDWRVTAPTLSHQPAYDTYCMDCQQMWSETALGLLCFVERKIHQPSDDSQSFDVGSK